MSRREGKRHRGREGPDGMSSPDAGLERLLRLEERLAGMLEERRAEAEGILERARSEAELREAALEGELAAAAGELGPRIQEQTARRLEELEEEAARRIRRYAALGEEELRELAAWAVDRLVGGDEAGGGAP